MRSPQEISKDIISLIQDSKLAADDSNQGLVSKIQNLIQKEIDTTKLHCNQCGEIIDKEDKDKWGRTKVKKSWGYSSTAKDGDYDRWDLCKACTESVINKYPLVCNVCRKSIHEVMADIDAKNPHCLYYGDYEAALKAVAVNQWSTEQYVNVNDRIICEWCYDEITAKFKISISPTNYMISTGDLYQEEQSESRINRVSQALEVRSGDCGDCTRERYEAVVPYPEAFGIRKSKEKENQIIKASVEIYREEYQTEENRKIFGPDKVNLSAGDYNSYEVPCDWFLARVPGSQRQDLDFTKPAIFDQGRVLALGAFRITFKEIQANFTPAQTED